MHIDSKNRSRRVVRTLVLAAVVAAAGCDLDILDVDDSAIIVPEDLDEAGPSAIPTFVAGVVGSYAEAADGIARYSALLTDEMIAAGTFPTRLQVDFRRILPANSQLVEELYAPLHRARFQADTTAILFEARLDDPAFADAQRELREGIARSRLIGGYARLWLGELYCWSILTGVTPETSPVLPDDRIEGAIALLENAESEAAQLGLADVRAAAIVGQARGHLWLGRFDRAAELASSIPRGWVGLTEYSGNNPEQYNEMYVFTWGDTELIRWTVGNGAPSAAGEAWPYLEQFVALNLVTPTPPGFAASNGRSPVFRQNLYGEPASPILLASWAEAALIRAEVAIRNGETGDAESILNDLRSDYSQRALSVWGVLPPAGGSALGELELEGELQADMATLIAERARELWLTGDRHVTGRRLRLDPAVQIDLFPSKVAFGGGDDIAFPIPGRELDNNPALGPADACPVGQGPGSWR